MKLTRAPDHITEYRWDANTQSATLTNTLAKPVYKYGEDVNIAEFAKYIESTYGEHYIGSNNIQAFDVWLALGSAETSFRDTAIKYLYRYGKKGGYNRKDLMKAMHYVLLLLYTHAKDHSPPTTANNLISGTSYVVSDITTQFTPTK